MSFKCPAGVLNVERHCNFRVKDTELFAVPRVQDEFFSFGEALRIRRGIVYLAKVFIGGTSFAVDRSAVVWIPDEDVD